jgi:hypothetical protein
LDNNPDVDPIPFFIEPLDAIDIGAWPAKAQGIITVATTRMPFSSERIRLSSSLKEHGRR